MKVPRLTRAEGAANWSSPLLRAPMRDRAMPNRIALAVPSVRCGHCAGAGDCPSDTSYGICSETCKIPGYATRQVIQNPANTSGQTPDHSHLPSNKRSARVLSLQWVVFSRVCGVSAKAKRPTAQQHDARAHAGGLGPAGGNGVVQRGWPKWSRTVKPGRNGVAGRSGQRGKRAAEDHG